MSVQIRSEWSRRFPWRSRPDTYSILILALTLGAASIALAQVAATDAPAPVTFSKSVRSSNPRAATPQFAAIASGLYARTIVDTQSEKGDYKIQNLVFVGESESDDR